MSCRKYVLKKDLKPIVIKVSSKLPSISTPTAYPSRLKLAFSSNSPTNIKHKIKPKRVTKSLNNYFKMKTHGSKSYAKKSLLNTTYLKPMVSQTPYSNIRYLKQCLEDDLEEKNIMETPSDTSKIPNNLIEDQFAIQYENYLFQTPDLYTNFIKKKLPATPKVYKKHKLVESRINLNDTPPEIENILHPEKI